MNTLIPTQLFIGNAETLYEETEYFLQKYFCKNESQSKDCFCNDCRKIKNQQHEFIVFIEPEKDYKIKDIDVIFEKINFALDKNQNFFFILQKAQTLNLACANKLLKVLEEPPEGYNFILHSNNLNSILPTIRSRCHIVNYRDTNESYQEDNPLLLFFYNNKLQNPSEFTKELKNQALTDNQSLELAQKMLIYYASKITNHFRQNNSVDANIKHTQKIYEYLKEKLQKPPQSGSSTLFWKNLYINFPRE